MRRDAEVELRPMSEADARAVARWRYEPPFDLYDGAASEIPVMLDPVNRYRAVDLDGDLVGFVCVGPDARVAGQMPQAGVDDIGWGFRPDLTGRGLASRWLAAALDRLAAEMSAPTQRVVIAAWNTRSQAAATRLGFDAPSTHVNHDGEWVVMTRAANRDPPARPLVGPVPRGVHADVPAASAGSRPPSGAPAFRSTDAQSARR